MWSDSLPLLLDALESAGEAYDAHAVSANFEGGGALSAEESLHVAGANAVLCRRTSDIEMVGEATGDFETVLHLPADLEQVSFDVKRSWGWVDVRVGGEPLRFVNTHIEAYDAQVRAAQRDELLAAVAEPDVPVVVVGDFNAGPADVGMPAPYVDAWLAAGNDPDGGLTCGQGADLSNPTSQLHERIDYVFVRDARVDGCWVVGDRSEDRTTGSTLVAVGPRVRVGRRGRAPVKDAVIDGVPVDR